MAHRRPTNLMIRLLASAVSALVLSACANRAPTPQSIPIASDLAVATFDTAWALIDRNHFDADHGGVDWQAVRDELRPRASTVDDVGELRTLLREMIARTGFSHFGLIPGQAVDALRDDDDTDGGSGGGHDAGVGIRVRIVDGRIMVWRVDDGSPSAAANIQPGWVLTDIGQTSMAGVFERTAGSIPDASRGYMIPAYVQRRLTGDLGSDVTLGFLDSQDDPKTLTVTRVARPGVVNQLGNLPPIRTRLEHRLVERGDLRIGVISFNIWLLPIAAQFDDAIDRYRDADGLIIDLRGNLGGVGGMVMGMAGHLLTEPVSLGEMKTRTTSLQFRANPRLSNRAGQRVAPFAGPVAILQDGLSMSTSEIFAGGLQSLGRVRVFGQRSPGAALPSRLERLPNGDVLQFAFADFLDPDGIRLEGRGVVPDETVPLRRADLLAHRDAPLDAALRWIESTP